MSGLMVIFLILNVAKAEDHAYVADDVYIKFPCEPLPKTSFCPVLDISVTDANEAMETITKANSSFNSITMYANQSCLEAFRKTTCLGIARCEPKRIYVDVDAAIGECEKGNSLCPEIVNQDYLNCTDKREHYAAMSEIASNCETVQDSTGFCPDVNYKYAVAPGMKVTELLSERQRDVVKLKPHISSDCYDKIKAMSCQLAPVCSDDENFAVWLFSIQQCLDRLECVPKSVRQSMNLTELCEDLPDEDTAKKVPVPSGGSEPTSGPTSGAPRVGQTLAPMFSALLLLSIDSLYD